MCEFKEKKMEDEEMLRSRARDRLTPRLFFICDKNLCYPVDATYALYDVGQRLGILDVCAMESDEFTNPCARKRPPTHPAIVCPALWYGGVCPAGLVRARKALRAKRLRNTSC